MGCLPVHSSHKPWDNWGVSHGVPCSLFPDGFVLTPGRYVGAEDVVDEGELFENKMGRLTEKIGEQFRESERLEMEIAGNLKKLGYVLLE